MAGSSVSSPERNREATLLTIARLRELPALLLLGVVVAWLAVARPAFHTPGNLAQLGQDAALLGIMAMGEAMVILTGGIDLSVGATLALSACVGGSAMMHGCPWTLALALSVLAGGTAGWINGALITYRRLPPILVTLATLMLFRAGTNVITGATPYNQLPAAFQHLGGGVTPFVILVAAACAFALLLARTRLGRRTVAVGGSEEATRLSGVPVDAVLRRVYLLSGICAAVAGILSSAANNNAQWNLGDGVEMEVIAAVVIGGVRLTGGEGSLLGAAVGAMLIVVLRNALVLSGVANEQYGLVIGAVILLAALAEQARRGRLSGPVVGRREASA